jgi:Zn-finger nucleic acid-binding protein
VQRCKHCGGIWFDKDQLAAVKDERDQDLAWLGTDLWRETEKLQPSGTFIDCPRDGSPLYKLRYAPSDVTVDICLPCHGVWLDKDELDKILSELQQHVQAETVPEYLRDLEEEFKDLVLEPGQTKEELRNILLLMKLLEYRLAAEHPAITKITSVLPD